jgi:hypothetical protein
MCVDNDREATMVTTTPTYFRELAMLQKSMLHAARVHRASKAPPVLAQTQYGAR